MPLTSFFRSFISAFFRVIAFIRAGAFFRPLLPARLLLCTLVLLSPLRAESSLYIKPDDDVVRATERLHDFLDDIGYSLEYTDEDKDSLIIHQQQHRIHATLYLNENELRVLNLTIHYKFNPKCGTPASRAVAANAINNGQCAMKLCVNEERSDFYFEYALPFEAFLRPSEMKRFTDQAIARTYAMISQNKELQAAFFGDDDSPDTARNADEVEDADAENCDPEEAPAIPTPLPDAASPAASGRGDATPAPSVSAPSASDSSALGRGDATSSSTPAPAAPAPSSSLVPVNPPSSSAPTAPLPPSLETALPPTTPAEPARPKKARA